MDLNDILPKNFSGEEWKICKDTIFKSKIIWIPVAKKIDNELYIFLDLRIKRELLKVIQIASRNNIEFYLISPLVSNKRIKISDSELHSLNIENYLNCYSNKFIYDGVRKINFDIIGNLIDYCNKFNCKDSIKDIYLVVNKNVQLTSRNWYSNELIYNVDRIDIRNEFNSLYRDIQLSQILK